MMNVRQEKNILVALGDREYWPQLNQLSNVTFCGEEAEDINDALTEETHILFTDSMPTQILSHPRLEWIQLASAGTNQLMEHPLLLNPVRISNAAGICSVHIAEFVTGQIIRHYKKFDVFTEMKRISHWPADRTALSTSDLRGKRVLIVGYGGVGRETARILQTFGMKISAIQTNGKRQTYGGYMPYDGIGDPDCLIPDRVFATAELREAVSDADIIVISVPLTLATRHLFNKEIFDHMQQDAILINISRGAVVETHSLIEALNDNKFAHAYLDVFEVEPLPQADPLWLHPQVTITPHMAGVMPDALAKLEHLFIRNLERFLDGSKLLNELDRKSFVT